MQSAKAKKYILLSLVIFITYIFFLYSNKLPFDATRFENDEVSWFFHSKAFIEAFVNKDFKSDYWPSSEAYDHPHLAKYIYGWRLFTKFGSQYLSEIKEIEKELGRWNFYQDFDLKDFSSHPVAKYIKSLEEINIRLIFVLVLVLSLLLMEFSKSFLISFLYSLFLLKNAYFINTMIRVRPDLYFILFLFLAIFCLLSYLKTGKSILFYLFALFSSFSLSSKLTGVLAIISFLPFLLLSRKSQDKFFTARKLTLSLIIFVFTWFVLNPTLYASPIANSIKYFRFRHEELLDHRSINPKRALFSIKDRMVYLSCGLYINQCSGISYARMNLTPLTSINITLFALGIYKLILLRKKNPFHIYFLLTILAAFTLISAFMTMSFERYLIAPFILTTITQFVGLGYLIGKLKI